MNTQFDYSQNDTRWRDVPLGFNGKWFLGNKGGNNAVSAGCAISSFAAIASNLGHPITPPEMLKLMVEKGLINQDGDFTRDDVLAVCFSDIEYVETVKWQTEPAPLQYFNIRNDLNTEEMVLIDSSPTPGLQMHFLRVIGWDGANDVTCMDPWDGKRKGLSGYASRQNKSVPNIIYRAIKYRRKVPIAPSPSPTPSAPQAAPPAVPAPASNTPTATDVIVPTAPGTSVPPVAIPAPLPRGGASDSNSEPPAGAIKPNLPRPAGLNEPPIGAYPQRPAPKNTPAFLRALLSLARFLFSIIPRGVKKN